MKKFLASILAALIGTNPAFAGTSPIYINNSPLTLGQTPPNIDATAFLNRSTFEVFSFLPFTGQNVAFWTNNGVMSGTPGYRFDNESDGSSLKKPRSRRTVKNSKALQRPSQMFLNDGNISVTESLLVNANNIVNPGRLDGGEVAFISLVASNGYADLNRGGIRVGPATGNLTPCISFFSVSTNFTADTAITDLYWGAGRGDAVDTNATPLSLANLATGFSSPNFSLPFPTSPLHQVITRSGSFLFTNSITIGANGFGLFGGGCGNGYTAYVHTNVNNPTNTMINIVFVATNSLISPSNLNVDVRFISSFGPAGSAFAPVVEFRNVDFDIVNQQYITNYLTFIDATASQTNVLFARPITTTTGARIPNTRRPSTYTWFRGRYCNFDSPPIIFGTNVFFTGAQPANSVFDPSVFYNALFTTNFANDIYAAHSVHVGQTNAASFAQQFFLSGSIFQQLGVNPGLSDPTNFTGNVNILARSLNLASTRIKSEDFIGIHTDNLVSNTLAQLDAPFIDFDVATTNSSMVLSNIAPSFVNRLFGTVSAWSGAWTADITNTTTGGLESQRFHVLIIDNCLESQQPVTLHRFQVKAPSLIIHDNLSVNSGINLKAPALTIQSNASLNLPVGANFAFTNAADLLNFTNHGGVNISGAAYFGVFEAGHVSTNVPPKKKKKRKTPPVPIVPAALANFVNDGSILGSSLLIRSTNLQNVGRTFFPSLLTANGGVILATGSTLNISNAEIRATSDIEFHGNNLSFASTFISAGTVSNALGQYIRGALVIDATNSFGDLGTTTTNDWFVTSGVRLPRLPAIAGDLMGTRIYSTAGALISSRIAWPGVDRGTSPAGFSGNIALGRLVLDGFGRNLFRFSSGVTSNALYVDFLELRNDATNFNGSITIDPDFTVYFADSNVEPERLVNISGGRFRWVRDFAGPQSSTNLTYTNGVTYTFNAGLVRSLDIDSDNDGVPNGIDCAPIIPPGEASNSALWFGAQCSGPIILPAPVRAAALSVELGLAISLSSVDGEVTLTWNAPAGATSTVEYAETLGAGSWHTLTNLINGSGNTRLTVKDTAGAPLRVYRVRVDAVNP